MSLKNNQLGLTDAAKKMWLPHSNRARLMCKHVAYQVNTFREFTVLKRLKFNMMHKITLLLIALFLVSVIGFASVNPKSADRQQKTTVPVINIKIDLGDITNLNESEIATLINQNLGSCIPDTPKLQCSVTVGASFSVGVATFTVSVTVSGDCSEVYADGNEIANQIIARIKARIIKNF